MSDKYFMSLSLSVLEHLGLNLYSNVPAVISEVVANAWDADARRVDITIDTVEGLITIVDDGSGMTKDDINNKYLFVGYHRREEGAFTAKFERHVMGRKGIGKLSLFAIAETITVETKRGHKRNGFRMNTDDIRQQITAQTGTYSPTSIAPDKVGVPRGTKLTLADLRVGIGANTATALRRRLARRFAILGPKYKFKVVVNGDEVGVADRDYYNKVEYLWSIGDVGDEYEKLCGNAKKKMRISGDVDASNGWRAAGWVGTVDERKHLTEDMNVIPVLAWGKLIHEDMLATVKPSGLYSKYLVGELHADFVDDDNLDDIGTSDRQSLKETDPRFIGLTEFLQRGVLRVIGNSWRDWRRNNSLEKARTYPAIERWYSSLGVDAREHAKTLFATIEEIPLEEDAERLELYKYGILAFEKLRLKDLLSQVDAITGRADLEMLGKAFAQLDEIELVQYGEIVRGRVAVIEQFASLVDEDAKERVLQRHLFDHLWLLNPSWERASTNQRIEQKVTKEFKKVTDKLKPEERDGRIDIRYRTAAGKHIIVELKRYSVKVSTDELLRQLTLYRGALQKCLKTYFPDDNDPIECIAVLGSPPSDLLLEEVERILDGINARVITYDVLIRAGQESYDDFIKAHKSLRELANVIADLETIPPELKEVTPRRARRKRTTGKA